MDLAGKTALVLGGIKGIGKAVALALAREKMNVAVNYFDWESHLDTLIKDLGQTGADHLVTKNNLLEEKSAERMVNQVLERFGRLDVLINNIERGGWPSVHGPYTEEQWDLEVRTTLLAKHRAFESAYPYLAASQDGVVVNMSSISGIVGRSGPAAPVFADAYAAANRGVSSLTETWARTGAPHVRAVEIMLGFFETRHGPGTRGWDKVLGHKEKQAILDHTPLGRTGTLSDVVGAVLFVIRDAPFLTGSILRLDGGYVLGGEKPSPLPSGVVSGKESVFGD